MEIQQSTRHLWCPAIWRQTLRKHRSGVLVIPYIGALSGRKPVGGW